MGEPYHERLLDHYRNPRNRGRLEGADISARADNPFCGDTVRLDIVLDEQQRVGKIGFSGDGCVVCIAAASMLTEELVGKTIEEARRLDDGAVLDLLGVSLGPVRTKCALLPLRALQKGIVRNDEPR